VLHPRHAFYRWNPSPRSFASCSPGNNATCSETRAWCHGRQSQTSSLFRFLRFLRFGLALFPLSASPKSSSIFPGHPSFRFIAAVRLMLLSRSHLPSASLPDFNLIQHSPPSSPSLSSTLAHQSHPRLRPARSYRYHGVCCSGLGLPWSLTISLD
jgi:hypothetical protein